MLRLKRIWEGDKPKLSHYLSELKPNNVLIPFGHGLGDTIMFLNVLDRLASLYPKINFTLALQKGLGFEELEADIICKNISVVYTNDLSYNDLVLGYDIIADIDFPMSEGQTELTKGEYCCVHELGISPVNGHKKIHCGVNRLIGIHYNITCLPDACNPDEETAKRIWEDVIECCFIPIEIHFQHIFHNPVNKKFDFVDCSVRKVKPRISTLVGLIEQCAGVICVVSGNFHTAVSILPPERIFFLEKHFKLESFTKIKIAKASIMPGEYKNEVKDWIVGLDS